MRSHPNQMRPLLVCLSYWYHIDETSSLIEEHRLQRLSVSCSTTRISLVPRLVCSALTTLHTQHNQAPLQIAASLADWIAKSTIPCAVMAVPAFVIKHASPRTRTAVSKARIRSMSCQLRVLCRRSSSRQGMDTARYDVQTRVAQHHYCGAIAVREETLLLHRSCAMSDKLAGVVDGGRGTPNSCARQGEGGRWVKDRAS